MMEMTIDEMFNELKDKARDTIIVTLKYKYDFEEGYTIENHILEYDSMSDSYVWLNDWYEGQTDIEVLGYMLLGDADTTKLESCEDAISREELLKKCVYAPIAPVIKGDGVHYEDVVFAKDIINAKPLYPKAKWIPVSERLPKEAYGCIVTVMDTNPMTLEEFENIYPDFVGWDGENWNDADGDSIPFEVIAWMPLPEPYKAESEE